MEEKLILETYEEKRKRVQEFNLTSDLFAGKVFEDLTACQELCRILMQDSGIQLKSVKTQYVIRHMESHSVQLDVLAEDCKGDMISIEMQMYGEPAPFKRVRYYVSCIDVSTLEKGKGYDGLPAITMLYITKRDFIGGCKGLYQVDRKAGKSRTVENMDMNNGICERYFNLEYSTADPKIDELLKYLKDSNPLYKTKAFPRIVERVNYYKIQKEGVDTMCEIADRIRNEGKTEGKIESILILLEQFGKVPARIVEQVDRETNLDILNRWLKCAAAAASMVEFEMKM